MYSDIVDRCQLLAFVKLCCMSNPNAGLMLGHRLFGHRESQMTEKQHVTHQIVMIPGEYLSDCHVLLLVTTQ